MRPKKDDELLEEVLSVLPPSRPANIFLMEFIVDDLQMFQLPGDVIDSDPSAVEFRFLDSVFVSIDESEICSAARSNGKNCLFTLADRPSAATPVRIEVLKRPEGSLPIPIGYGEIAIDKAFENLFRISLPEEDEDIINVDATMLGLKSTEHIAAAATAGNSGGGSKQALASKSKCEDVVATSSSFPLSQVYKAWHQLQGSASSKSASSVATVQSKSREYGGTVGVICVRLRITCFGQTIVSPFQYNKCKKTCSIRNDKFTIDCDQIFMPVMTQYGSTPGIRSDICDSCYRRGVGAARPASQKSNRSRSGRSGTNRTVQQKCMYECEQKTQRALQDLCSVCGQMERQAPICPPSTGVPCQTYPAMSTAPVTTARPAQQQRRYDLTSSTQPTSDAASEMILNPAESLTVDPSAAPAATDGAAGAPPVPPASKTDLGRVVPEFDEFRTDVNENTLIVRVAKNSRRVCRIGGGGVLAEGSEKQDLSTEKAGEVTAEQLENQMPLCDGDCGAERLGGVPQLRHRQPSPKRYAMTCTDDGNDLKFHVPTRNCNIINSLGLPVIRGNRKYPAGFQTNFKMPQCPSMTPAYRPMLSDPRNCCLKCAEQTADFGSPALCPEGIEVCKKPSPNPNFDVFVLKLAPTDARLEDHIELELHTPKSPTAPAFKETVFAQTYEEDFCEPYTGGSGKKGGKKGAEAKGGKKK